MFTSRPEQTPRAEGFGERVFDLVREAFCGLHGHDSLLQFKHDPRQVITDPSASYFGGKIPSDALFPDQAGMTGSVRFSEWLVRTQTHG